MDIVSKLILEAGRGGIELALFVLLPLMLVMLTLMRFLEKFGLMRILVKVSEPVLKPFGVPGLGVLAMFQILFISFAAPMVTLSAMDRSRTNDAHLAATLAMVIALPQANVSFPLAPFGLNIVMTWLFGLLGAFVASAVTYYLLFPKHSADDPKPGQEESELKLKPQGTLETLRSVGREAWDLAFGAIPFLVLSLLLVGMLREVGIANLLIGLFAPFFNFIGVSDQACLPILTKFIAGGTAMFGILVSYLDQHLLTALDINRLAGLAIHPFDIPGISILVSAGARLPGLTAKAMLGASVGIAIRAILHLLWF